jgi:hypothetical protein
VEPAPRGVAEQAGTLQGYVVPSAAATRAVCYCKDCQAYARFLSAPCVVDSSGGTEIVASLPKLCTSQKASRRSPACR